VNCWFEQPEISTRTRRPTLAAYQCVLRCCCHRAAPCPASRSTGPRPGFGDARKVIGRVLRRQCDRVDSHVGVLGQFVRTVIAGEIIERTGTRLCIETFRIAPLAHRERRVYENFDKPAGFEKSSRKRPLGTKRGDERCNDDEARINHQSRDFGHASNVLSARRVREVEVAAETLSNVVAMEYIAVPARWRL
jgi:hypothetical protein